MSVTVTTVDGHYDEPRRIHFHNGFGWFLDSIFALIGDERAPAFLFSQAIAPCDPEPGDLSPDQAQAFGELIDSFSDEQLEDFMWRAMDGRDAGGSGMGPAIATVREIAELAAYSTNHGGLTFL